MFELIILGVAGIGGYTQAKKFVQEKLRFVDAAHKPAAKFVAGVAATAVAAPVVAVLPIIGAGTAIAFGISVGLGVAHASKDNNRLTPGS
jgi:hypothetical protein